MIDMPSGPSLAEQTIASLTRLLGASISITLHPNECHRGYFYRVRFTCNTCAGRWQARVEQGDARGVVDDIVRAAEAHGVCALDLGPAGAHGTAVRR